MAIVGYEVRGNDQLRATYRYLRLAMLSLIITLGVSVVLEINGDSGWLGSISAYYYTPVHAVFIGALIAIGVNLITIKGRNAAEEVLLNVAGAFAFIVALVPTSENVCGPGNDSSTCVDEVYVTGTQDLIRNNVPSLLIGLALAVLLVVAFLRLLNKRDTDTSIAWSTIWSFGTIVLFVVGGWIWYANGRSSFEENAHGAAAVALFLFVWLAVLVNTGVSRRLSPERAEQLGAPHDTLPASAQYRQGYTAVLVAMVVVAVIGFVLNQAGEDTWVFWLEVGEIACLALYWVLQTVEGWDDSADGRARAA